MYRHEKSKSKLHVNCKSTARNTANNRLQRLRSQIEKEVIPLANLTDSSISTNKSVVKQGWVPSKKKDVHQKVITSFRPNANEKRGNVDTFKNLVSSPKPPDPVVNNTPKTKDESPSVFSLLMTKAKDFCLSSLSKTDIFTFGKKSESNTTASSNVDNSLHFDPLDNELIKTTTTPYNEQYETSRKAVSSLHSKLKNNRYNEIANKSTKIRKVSSPSTSERQSGNKIYSTVTRTKNWADFGSIVNSLNNKYFGSDGNNVPQDESMEWEEGTETISPNHQNGPKFYIVVDTNIFIDDLSLIKNLVNEGSNGGTKPIIYVPWMVLSELDFMKDDRSTSDYLKHKVQEAVKYINRTLLDEDKKLIGQSVLEADEQLYVGKAPDDKIVSCCLQAKQKYRNVIMLSNDINLKNKILVNGIPAISSSDLLKMDDTIINTTNPPTTTNDVQNKFLSIQAEMSDCCSFIICECTKESYGSVWKKMALLENPPWSLEDCFTIFKKYWSTVFREKFLKQCLKAMEQLESTHKELELSKTPKLLDSFVEKCISVCIFFKDFECHKDFVEKVISDIRAIHSKS